LGLKNDRVWDPSERTGGGNDWEVIAGYGRIRQRIR